ncbi:MAG: hypothetical protein ABIH10_00095 [Spirochaetota bacterium]
MNKYSNVIRVGSTGHKVLVFRNNAMTDVEEFQILFCDVEPEKGELTYDTNTVAAKLFEKTPLTSNIHISSRRFITEEELSLMEERGVEVVIIERITCYKRDTLCNPAKATSGGCIGCTEFERWKKKNK